MYIIIYFAVIATKNNEMQEMGNAPPEKTKQAICGRGSAPPLRKLTLLEKFSKNF